MIAWIILSPLIGASLNGLIFASGLWNRVCGGGEHSRHSENRIVSLIGCSVILISAVISTLAFLKLLSMAPSERQIVHELFTWIPSGDFSVKFDLLFDTLSSVMALVITWVSFLIHLYSIGYMHDDRAYARYFTYLNVFVFFMLILVLGNSFPLMFVGWEGVGLASYLLIGFWYDDPEKAYAGRKAFVVNRIGDFGFILGIFLIFFVFGSVGYGDVFAKVLDANFMTGVPAAAMTAIALLLFVGAMGKSAQFPLYVWLPDAMAGPTPVSALIHAATMVTAGVYMVARCNVIFTASPSAQAIVVGIAAFTAFIAATIALTQTDIKKVLAYSTVSQLGYMLMAVGSGAYVAGMFHLVTHAFFKALLFLGSGSVIHALGGEQDIRRMGGLRKYLPVTSKTFLIGTLAISGVPFLSGFFSKDEILASLYGRGFTAAWLVGLATAVLTAFYMMRLYFLTFEGRSRMDEKTKRHAHESPLSMTLPLMVLAALSILGGYVGVPEFIGEAFGIHGSNVFEHYLAASIVIGEAPDAHHALGHWTLVALSIAAALLGIIAAYFMYMKHTPVFDDSPSGILYKGSYGKWFIDEIYAVLFLRPFAALSRASSVFDARVIDGIVNGVASVVSGAAAIMRLAQTGFIRFYAALMALGAVVIIAYIVMSAGSL
ncbi:MAG: NADH-quinone oxidoreductase subunit L [Deltaproteobacteria bacterium]